MVAGLVVGSIVVRAWAGRLVAVPWIAPDEMIYGLLGRSLYGSGSLVILGGPTPFFSLVVPGVVGVPLSFHDLAFGYGVLKVVQAMVMSLVAVPVYLWARSLMSERLALMPAALSLLLPGLVYSGLVMSEVVFYPVFVVAAWAMARALERPTVFRQVLLAMAIVVAVLTRLQALVLVPAFVTAVGFEAALSRSMRKIRSFGPLLVALALCAGLWVGWRAGSSDSVLGGYATIARDPYSVGRAARFVVYHAGAVAILSGIFPLCALLLLILAGASKGESDTRVRAFLAVTGSLVVWLVVEVGVFASRYVGQLAERDLIGLAPLLFLAFAVWLDRGAPRPYWPVSLVSVTVAAALVVLPLDRFVTAYAPPDAPSLASFVDFVDRYSLHSFEVVFYAAVAVALVGFGLVPRRAITVLPIVLAAALAGASVAASRYTAGQAALRQQATLGPDPRWIDHAADGPVAYLVTPGADGTAAWEAIFWNNKIDRIYDLADAKVFGPIPQQRLRVRPDGVLIAANQSPTIRYLVAPVGSLPSAPAIAFNGQIVATSHQPGNPLGDQALWKLNPPTRLAYRTTGLKPNGDIYPGLGGRILFYGCPTGNIHLTLLIKQPQTVTIRRNGTTYQQTHFTNPAPNQPWRPTIPTPPPRHGNRCTIDIQPTGLLGTTVIQFTPTR